MSVQIVRFRTAPEDAPEVEAAIARLFAAPRWAGGPVPPIALRVLGRYRA